MNIAAFLLSLVGAGLSLFQSVITIPYFGSISYFDLLSAPNSELKSYGDIVLIVAVIAVTFGALALTRKTWKSITFSAAGNLITLTDYVIGLAVCGVLCVLMSLSVGMFFLWALFYFASTVCTYIDSIQEPSANSFSFPALGNILSPKKHYEPLIGIETTALIKRGKIFLSDGDFSEAERYFEQALKQDPENSLAYLGKLMAQMRVHNLGELSRVSSPLKEQNLFRRAVEFANDSQKPAILKCLATNTEYLERIRLEAQQRQEEEQRRRELESQEKRYRKACDAQHYGETKHDVSALKYAAEMFTELGDYRDSKALAEKCRNMAADKSPEKMYSDAVYFKKYGEDNHNIEFLKRAAEIFDGLGDCKDSKILADETWKHYAKELERAELAKKQAEERAAAIKGVIFVLVVAFILLMPLLSFITR